MTYTESDNLYQKMVIPFKDNFKKVVVPEAYANRIRKFAEELVVAKSNERDHIIDGRNEHKRWLTGLMGEAALECLLDTDIIDWSIGHSSRYNSPDIKGYNVGVKSVESGKFPMIYKNNTYPQIIMIKSKSEHNTYYVCGLATPEVLNKYQDDRLILSKGAKGKGYKTCFYGFEHLIPISSLDDLKKYKKRSNW